MKCPKCGRFSKVKISEDDDKVNIYSDCSYCGLINMEKKDIKIVSKKKTDYIRILKDIDYIKIFKDPVTLQTLKNTVFWVGGGTVFSVLVGLAIGTFISKESIVTKFLTAIMLIPWILPEIIVSALWKWMFNGDWGIINQLIYNTGIIDDYVYWFNNPKSVLIVLTFITSWRVIPFSALIISASILSVRRHKRPSFPLIPLIISSFDKTLL